MLLYDNVTESNDLNGLYMVSCNSDSNFSIIVIRIIGYEALISNNGYFCVLMTVKVLILISFKCFEFIKYQF